MEELCRSIGHQNATILTGQSASSAQSLAPIRLSYQQPYAENAHNQEDTRKSQDGADDGEKSVTSIDSGETRIGPERTSVDASFTDELSAYIPKDSVLMRSFRDRKPKGLFITERYPVGCQIQNLEGDLLQQLLADSNLLTGGALIIQDINQDWAEILRSEFPETVHTTFLAEHMSRLDDDSTTEASLKRLGNEISNVCPGARLTATDFSDECLAINFGFPFRLPKHNGMHIDFLFQTMALERVPRDYSFLEETRRTVYEKDASKRWRRVSHRMSWCQLGEKFYLILVESSPGFDQELSSSALKENPFHTLLDPRIDACKMYTQPRLPIEYAAWAGPNSSLRLMIAQLLQYHTVQSVFAPVAVPINETLGKLRSGWHEVESSLSLMMMNAENHSDQLSSTRGNRQILVWLLTESTWQLAISNLEYRWQRVRCEVTKLAYDESFSLLTGLRRQVADAHDLIIQSKEAFTRTMKETGLWVVNGRVITADEFWSGKPGATTTAIFRHAQSMDVRNLPDSFQNMEQRMSAMTLAINQEIQVVIGSVQVEDAKTMKRQTEWMVALALLAAIYLPMTLVTGIFGMNISEINADEMLPSKWTALKMWGIVFGATLGCMLMYAMVRRLIRWVLELRELAKADAIHIEALIKWPKREEKVKP